MNRRQSELLLAAVVLLVAVVACDFETEAEANQAATVAAISNSIAETATASANNAEDAPAESVATAALVATQERAEAQVQEVAATTEAADAIASTAESLTPIQKELASLGLDPQEGTLGWTHEPVTVAVEGYLQFDYANKNLATVAEDFVMAADITWNTRFGTTGCGFVARSDGNEEAFNQYLIIATRGANGHVGFITQREGEVIQDESFDIYANGIDPSFEWQNDTTNRLVVVARGDRFGIYTNGTLIGEIDAISGFEKGFTAFVALNESGDTTCTFENAWLWRLN